MAKLIYVFNTEDRDYLLSNGFLMVGYDEYMHRYIFSVDSINNFSLKDIDPDVQYIESNILTF